MWKHSREWIVVALVMASVAGACGGGGDGGAAATAAVGLGEPCGKAACKTGLYCGAADWVDGICTADCQGFGTCEPHFGPDAHCDGSNRGVCIKECVTDDDCKGASCVKLPGASWSACTR